MLLHRVRMDHWREREFLHRAALADHAATVSLHFAGTGDTDIDNFFRTVRKLVIPQSLRERFAPDDDGPRVYPGNHIAQLAAHREWLKSKAGDE